MFKEARVEPSVDFERLEVVLVITNFQPTKLD
jgi:cell shape-determining protein MreC